MKKTKLKAKTGLRARAKPKKQKKPSITILRRKADKVFSISVRLRDSYPEKNGEFWGKCITCSKTARVAWFDETGKLRRDRDWDAGHFVSRGNRITRFEPENVNLQCKYHCNKMKSGNREKYRIALRDKYGDKIPEKLEKMADNEPHFRFTIEYLEDVIATAEAEIEFYELDNTKH